MRGVLDALELSEALQDSGVPTPIGSARRIIVVIVNSLSVPPTDWDRSEDGPGTASVLLKSAGVPIDHYSYEAIELLKDTSARWKTMRSLSRAAAPSRLNDPEVKRALRVPQADIYAIDVSFAQLKDKAELAYLNQQPTSFVLTDEAVDRLRAAAGRILQESPDFQRLLKDVGVRVLDKPLRAPVAGTPQ
jgi:NTE family protein